MKKTGIQRLFMFSALSLALLLHFAFGAKKPNYGNEKTGFSLQYQLAKGQKLSYEVSAKTNEQMEMGGRVQGSDNDNFIAYTLVGSQTNDPSQLAGRITVNEMRMKSAQSPKGETEELDRDVSGVVGKSFGFTFSPQGKEIELAGIENLTIDMGPMAGGKRDIREQFVNMLPDFPNKPVKIGETWAVANETTLPMGSYSVKMITNTTSNIEGYDKIDDQECLRIHSKTGGTMEGSGKMMNFPFALKGDIASEGTWYFAYKKGFLTKASSNFELKATVLVNTGGDQGMSIPMSEKGVTELRLAKRASPK